MDRTETMNRSKPDIVRRIRQGQTIKQIAAFYKVLPITIYQRLRKWGLSAPSIRAAKSKAKFVPIPGYPSYRIAKSGHIQRECATGLRDIRVTRNQRRPLAACLERAGNPRALLVSLRTLLKLAFPKEGERLYQQCLAKSRE